MSTEGYRPTEEEMTRAQDSMSDEQKANSEFRESILIDIETHDRFAKYIESIRKGEKLPPDFSRGLQSSYGIYSEPFEGYDSSKDVAESDLPMWKELVSQDAFDRIERLFEKHKDDMLQGATGPFRILFAGRTLQEPTLADGHGRYRYWPEYDNCWMKADARRSEFNEYMHTGRDIRHISSSVDINLALKMTIEQKEEYVQYLLDTYGISEDQIKH